MFDSYCLADNEQFSNAKKRYTPFSFRNVEELLSESRGLENDELQIRNAVDAETLAADRLGLLTKFNEAVEELYGDEINEWLPGVQAVELHATKLREFVVENPQTLFQCDKITGMSNLAIAVSDEALIWVKKFDKKMGIAA